MLDAVGHAAELATAFRERFAGENKDAGDRFDEMAASLVKLLYQEAGLR